MLNINKLPLGFELREAEGRTFVVRVETPVAYTLAVSTILFLITSLYLLAQQELVVLIAGGLMLSIMTVCVLQLTKKTASFGKTVDFIRHTTEFALEHADEQSLHAVTAKCQTKLYDNWGSCGGMLNHGGTHYISLFAPAKEFKDIAMKVAEDEHMERATGDNVVAFDKDKLH